MSNFALSILLFLAALEMFPVDAAATEHAVDVIAH